MLPHRTIRLSKPKIGIRTVIPRQISVQQSSIWTSTSTSLFQKLINDVLKGCNFAMGYLDDIIIYSRTEKEHLEPLEEIFNRLRAAGLKLKLEKCSFFKKQIQYLGHLISADGIQLLPEKLESITKMPTPKNPKEVKKFLGLVGYYRKFVPRFADILRLLTHLTKKDVEFK